MTPLRTLVLALGIIALSGCCDRMPPNELGAAKAVRS
jgi:hypothetical protein